MRTKTVGAVALIVALLLSACTALPFLNELTGSGDIVERSYDLSGFSDVSMGSAVSGTITRGDDFSVTISIDDNLMQYVEVVTSGNKLTIGLQDGHGYRNSRFKANVVLPALTSVNVSGASNVSVDGFERGPEFSASVSGASNLTGSVSADALTLTISGGSTIDTSGSADLLVAAITGASHAALTELPVQNATLNLSGASNAEVVVAEQLDIVASGASHVAYNADATVGTQNLTGASSVTAR